MSNQANNEQAIGSPFFRTWARVVLDHPTLAFFGVLAISVLSAYITLTRLVIDNSIETFAASSDESQKVLEVFRDEFGRDDLFLITVEGDVFSLDYLKRLRALHQELAALDLDLETIGQRKADRDRARQEAGLRVNNVTKVETSTAVAGFEGFEDDEGWGEEGGGSIVDRITSLYNARRTRGTADGIVVGEWLDPFPADPVQLEQLKQSILADRTLPGRLVARDGACSAIVIKTAFMSEEDTTKVHRAMKVITTKHDTEGFRLLIGGLPALGVSLNTILVHDLRRLLVLALTIMTLILLLIFRHPLAVLGPIAVVLISGLWTYATMALTGMPMTMLTNVLPGFITCVGVGDSVHIQSVYRDLRREGMSNRDAIIRAVAETGVPCLLTTVTTFVALLSFNLASVDSISQMGTAGAFGVSFALLNSILLLPIVLALNKKSLFGLKETTKTDALDRFVSACGRLSRPGQDGSQRRLRVTLAAMVVVALLAGFGIDRLRVWHNPMTWIPKGDETKRAFDLIDQKLGGTASLNLFVEAKGERGMKQLVLLQGLEQLDAHVREYVHREVGQLVGASVSILDVVKETNQALHDGAPEYYALPPSDRAVSDVLFLFENAGREELQQLATTNLDNAHVTFQLKWMEATSYHDFIAHIGRGIDDLIEPGIATVRPTGSIYSVASVVSNLIRDLLNSFGGAFIVITLTMLLLFRDLKMGLLAMVPNILPVAVVLGFMGWVDIPLDLNTLLIASIVIGLAVDDTIHFLYHYKATYDVTNDTERAITRSLSHAGRAMVGTSIIISAGFLTYLGSSLINLNRFGMLASLAIASALLIDLIFGPALLRAVYKTKAQKP